jgi:hypothetical protein
MSGTGLNVLFLNYEQSIPKSFINELKKENSTRVVQSPSELSEACAELPEAVIFVDCGSGEEEVIARLKGIISHKELHKNPLVIVAENGDSFESLLERYFPNSVALRTPASMEQLRQAFSYVTKNLKPQEVQKPEEQTTDATAVEAKAKSSQQDDLVSSGISKAKAVFSELKRLNFDSIEPTVSVCSSRFSTSHLEKLQLLPSNEKTRSFIIRLFEESTLAEKNRYGRLGFISKSLAIGTKVGQEELDSLKSASFVYSSKIKGSRPRLLKTNYLQDSQETRIDLCSHLKDSAMFAATTLGDSETANIISGMAKLIAGEELEINSERFQAVSILVASDLIERNCFNTGYWCPPGAHYLMRLSKRGALDFVHQSVVAGIIRFLGNALDELPQPFVIPTAKKRDPQLRQLADEHNNYVPGEEERRVSVSSLEPGMRLAKPLTAFDGKHLLDDEIQLDEDLIWRIWQIQAVRPLISSQVIIRDNILKDETEN